MITYNENVSNFRSSLLRSTFKKITFGLSYKEKTPRCFYLKYYFQVVVQYLKENKKNRKSYFTDHFNKNVLRAKNIFFVIKDFGLSPRIPFLLILRSYDRQNDAFPSHILSEHKHFPNSSHVS